MNITTLLFLSFLATSGKIYIQWLVCDGASQGYRPVVMNYRGFGGIPLKVFYILTQFYSAML